MAGLLLERGPVSQGDNLIILTGAPIVERGHTSLMKLHAVKAVRQSEPDEDAVQPSFVNAPEDQT